MKQLLVILLILIAPNVFGQNGAKLDKRHFKLPIGLSSKDYVQGTIIVKFKDTSLGGQMMQSELIQLLKLKSASINQVKQLFGNEPSSAMGSNKSSAYKASGLERIAEIKYSSVNSIEEVINELLQNPKIEYAEPRYIYRAHALSPPPNDPLFTNSNNYQAYLEQVKAPEAWDIPIGSVSPVIIGIVDSGSQLNHSDLAANITHDYADPINGIDDDHDGYIDNLNGWDFVGAHLNNPQADNDPNVVNASNAHGVHVSGLVAAETNNGVGIASIANNYAQILIIKAGADDDSRAILAGYEGIKYAVDRGAKVISCSWGGRAGSSFGQDIINYAINSDCLVVAAAGNKNIGQPDYPSAYPGVFSVASVSASDQKSYFSNYGSQVSIAAPGENILSTYYDNTYAFLSGTSMATPLVSSAAALVRAKFPMLTMKLVGDQLKLTADFIDPQNPGYEGMLGQGRLNVYRALATTPTIRVQKVTLQDLGDGSIPSGDTLKVFFDLKNLSAPITGLSIQLLSADSNVVVSSTPLVIDHIGNLETKSMVGPFNVYVKPSTPDNQIIRFNLNYVWGAVSATESFSLMVSLNYLNVEVNRVATSITGNGRVGFSDSARTHGVGFLYNGVPMLYEASLMIGNSATAVSDNARSGSDGSYHEYFLKRVAVKKKVSQSAAFEGQSEFDDSGNPSPLHVYVSHSGVAYASAPNDKYTIVKYRIKNTGTSLLAGLYIGLFTDFDVSNYGANDVTQYDAANRLGYIYGKAGGTSYVGVKLLSHGAQPAYYPLSYNVSGGPLQTDGSFPTSGKYEALSSGIKSLGLGQDSANGYDVSFVSGQGPYTIAANDSVEVAFAFIGGDNLTDLQSSAIAAQNQYDQVIPSPVSPTIAPTVVLNYSYPNPSSGYSNVDFSIPRPGQTSILLYSMAGKLVKEILNDNLQAGWHHVTVDLTGIGSGIYFYSIHYEGTVRALEIEVSN